MMEVCWLSLNYPFCKLVQMMKHASKHFRLFSNYTAENKMGGGDTELLPIREITHLRSN